MCVCVCVREGVLQGPGRRSAGSAGFLRTARLSLISLNCNYAAITADRGQTSCDVEQARSAGIIHAQNSGEKYGNRKDEGMKKGGGGHYPVPTES